MENEIVEIVVARLQRERDRTIRLNSLGSFVNNLSKNKKKLIKRIGFEKFINKYPDKFALIDDNVILLEDADIPSHISRHSSNSPVDPPLGSIIEYTSCKPKEPPESAVLSRIEELEISKSCMICADFIEVFSYGKCFHPICFRCCTKLRVLCLDRNCPACRAELTEVVYTSILKPFSKLELGTFIKEQQYGIYFETRRINKLNRELLEHKCCHCPSCFDDFDRLKKHLKEKHGEYFCEICVRHLKIFTSHRETFTTEELEKHKGEGDDCHNPAYKGHPLCRFCDIRFLDRDELFRHLTMNHITCKLCVDGDGIFYADVENLWQHFLDAHHACDEPECRLDMNAAFRDPMDLQSHHVQRHPNMRNKAKRKEDRRVNLQDFSFKSPPREVHGSDFQRQADGSVLCNGTILVHHLHSYYGFIRPDSVEDFKENIFFNQQSLLGFGDDDEDLRLIFRDGDRVRVRAQNDTRGTRSKWRALTVERIDRRRRFQTTSESSDMSSASLNASEFPALESSPMPANPGTSTWTARSSNANAKSTYKSNVAPVASTATASASSSAVATTSNKQKKKPDDCPSEGQGEIHGNLMKDFGFIKWDGAEDFRDNIYFSRSVYVTKGRSNCQDLLADLKVGTRVGFKLEAFTPKQGVKSKYRAYKVWNISEKTASTVAPSTSNVAATNSAKLKSPPLEGVGRVHQKLFHQHGFIEWDGSMKLEETIYFTKAAFLKGEGKTEKEVKSLIGAVTGGTKVRYTLETKSASNPSSAKYRAKEVKLFEGQPSPGKSKKRKSAAASKSNNNSPNPNGSSHAAENKENQNSTSEQKRAIVQKSLFTQTPNSKAAANVHNPAPITQNEEASLRSGATNQRSVEHLDSRMMGLKSVHRVGSSLSSGTSSSDSNADQRLHDHNTDHENVNDFIYDSSEEDYDYDYEDEEESVQSSVGAGHSKSEGIQFDDKASGDVIYLGAQPINGAPYDDATSHEASYYDGDTSHDVSYGDAPYNDVIDSAAQASDEADASFASLLSDICPNSDKVLAALEDSAPPNGARFGNVFFVKMAHKEPTIAYAMDPEVQRSTEIQCNCKGIDENAVGGLIIKGSVASVNRNLLYAIGSGHYIMLHRDPKGSVKSLTLHYRK